MADLLRKYESLLTRESRCPYAPGSSLNAVTPQRMRMIVHAIEETLDKGLQKDGQTVVSGLYP